MHYYKCMRRKREGTCTKSILPKEKFEQFVIGIVCQLFGDKATTEKIADEIMRIHERRKSDQSVLQLLERDRDEVTRSLANIMKAIERGIFNETTKARMDELEQQCSEIDDKIAIEQCKHQNRLTKDKVISYLTDPLRQVPRRLIRALIEKILVFDDKIRIFFKYTKTSPEDTPWEMPSYPGSDSSNMVDTKVTCPNTRLKIIPEWFYRGHPPLAAYDSDSCSRSQSGRRKARFSVSGSLSAVSVAA